MSAARCPAAQLGTSLVSASIAAQVPTSTTSAAVPRLGHVSLLRVAEAQDLIAWEAFAAPIVQELVLTVATGLDGIREEFQEGGVGCSCHAASCADPMAAH